MRKDTDYLEFLWPMRHYLVTSGFQEKTNIIAVSFCMPVSKEPPLVAVAIGPKSYSYDLINKSKEFIINVPLEDYCSEIYFCGFHSGKNIDKFKEVELTKVMAKKLSVPIIDECVAFMECKVVNEYTTGDKQLIIGEVIEAYADESALKNKKELTFAQGEFPKKIYGTRNI